MRFIFSSLSTLLLLLCVNDAFCLKIGIISFENLTEVSTLDWLGRSILRSISLELKRTKNLDVVTYDVIKFEGLEDIKQFIDKNKLDILVFGYYDVEEPKLVSTIHIFCRPEIAKNGVMLIEGVNLESLIRLSGRTDLVYEMKVNTSRLIKLEVEAIAFQTIQGKSLPLTILSAEMPKASEQEITYAKEHLKKISPINPEKLPKVRAIKRSAAAVDFYNKALDSSKEEEEIINYQKAIFLYPDIWQAWYNLGVVYLNSNDLKRAIYYLIGFMERAPRDVQELKDKVRKILPRIIPKIEGVKVDREMAVQFLERALNLLDLSEDEVRYLEQSIEADPTLWVSRRRLAEIYFVKGMYQKALQEYREYVALNMEPEEILNRARRILLYLDSFGR